MADLQTTIQSLTPEQRVTLKKNVETELQRRQAGLSPEPPGQPNLPRRILSGFGEGLQTVTKNLPYIIRGEIPPEPKESVTDKINEMLATERAKRELLPKTPSEQLSEMELQEIERKKRGSMPAANEVINVETPTITPATEKVAEKEEPTMYINVPKGKDKYGVMEYKTEKNPAWERWNKRQETLISKTAESDAKKMQLKKDLDSFFAVDDLIDRAEGGFLATRKAGLISQYRALAQPLTEEGKSDVKSTAARAHDAASKRLRVQLVRAAGDVGNINIVEQEAAEKLIPGFYDSEESARLKRAYLKEVSKAIDSNDGNAVRQVLDSAGIGYIPITSQESNEDTEYQKYLQAIGQ